MPNCSLLTKVLLEGTKKTKDGVCECVIHFCLSAGELIAANKIAVSCCVFGDLGSVTSINNCEGQGGAGFN